MCEASKRNNKFLTIGYQTRSSINHQFLRKMVERGDLGEIYYMRAPNFRRRGVPLWGVFMDKEKQGGGPMIDIGTHSIDAALALMNNYDVESVSGSVYRKLADTAMNSNEWGLYDPKDFEVEDSAMGWIKFKNGATMVVEGSWLLNYTGEANLTLCGTKGGVEFRGGTIRVNGEKDGSLFVTDITPNSTARDLFHGQKLTGDEYEAKQWIYSVVNNVPPVVKPEQACVVSRIIESIYESAKIGKPIYFDD
jgi:predicted dehydrogenase